MIGNVSIFRATNEPDVVRVHEWEHLELFALTVTNVRDGNIELWSPATFKNNRRKSENAGALIAFVLDFDNGVSPEAFEESWEGLEYYVHSTWSHTADHPRWRAIFPLSTPVPAKDWPATWRKLAVHVGYGEHVVDKACKDPGRCYWLPGCPPEREHLAFLRYHKGERLNPDDYEDIPEEERKFPEPKQTGDPDDRPGAIFEKRETWENLLKPDGWKFVYQRGDRIMLRRDGKKRGVSAEIGGNGYAGMYVFTSNACVPAGYYSKFKYYALRHHGGDYRAAARQLAKEGYTDTSSRREAAVTTSVTHVTAENGLALEVHEQHFNILSASAVIDLPTPPYMVDGLFRRGDLVMMLGAPKAKKSFILLDLAASIASGRQFAERFPVSEPLRVLYATNEGRSGLGARLAAIRRHALDMGYADHALDERFLVSLTMPQMFTDTRPDSYLRLIDEVSTPPDVFIVDPWINATIGADENASGDQTAAIMGLRACIEAWNCAAIFAHHSGWEKGRTRGSSALDGHCDLQIVVERGIMSFGYAKDVSDFGSLRFTLAACQVNEFQESAYVEWQGESRQGTANILADIIAVMENGALERQWWTVAQLTAELDRKPDSIRRTLLRADEERQIAVIRPGNRQSNLYALLGTPAPEEP